MDDNFNQNSDLAVLTTRMESKVDASSLSLEAKIEATSISLNAKIDSLSDKLDYRMETMVAKIAAGDNESNARLGLLQERQSATVTRMGELEASIHRAYAFIAAIAVTVIGGIILTAIQVLVK